MTPLRLPPATSSSHTEALGVEWQPDSIDTLRLATHPRRHGHHNNVHGDDRRAPAHGESWSELRRSSATTISTREPIRRTAPEVADDRLSPEEAVIASNRLVILRLSDALRQRRRIRSLKDSPQPCWTKHQSAADPLRYDIPARSLESVVGYVNRALRSRGGNQGGRRSIVFASVASVSCPARRPFERRSTCSPDVDVIVAGEVREWESVEYARDKIFSGEKKGLILVGRVVSDEPGMAVCASWLKSFVPEVSIRHMAAGDPYWRPF